MSANLIGSVQFDQLLRPCPRPPGLRMETQDITRAGIDGQGAKEVGKRGDPFTWTGVAFPADNSAAETLCAAIDLLKGTVVTIYDPFGNSTANVLVDELSAIERTAVKKDGSNAIRVQVALKMHRLA